MSKTAGHASRCPMRWSGSSREPVPAGAGSGCFRNTIIRQNRAAVSCGGITCTTRPSSGLSIEQSSLRTSRSTPHRTRCGTASRRICGSAAERQRHSHRSGAVGPCGRGHHHALHPRAAVTWRCCATSTGFPSVHRCTLKRTLTGSAHDRPPAWTNGRFAARFF